jgi:hypothetical protein
MRGRVVRGLAMLALLLTVALGTAVATANGQSKHKLTAQVPFEFIVGDKTLDAGQYQVSEVGVASDALAIKGADSKNSAIQLARTTASHQSKAARLVFRRYGNTSFLSQVWEGGEEIGRQLPKSSQERAMERELSRIAGNTKSLYEEVVVLANVQ